MTNNFQLRKSNEVFCFAFGALSLSISLACSLLILFIPIQNLHLCRLLNLWRIKKELTLIRGRFGVGENYRLLLSLMHTWPQSTDTALNLARTSLNADLFLLSRRRPIEQKAIKKYSRRWRFTLEIGGGKPVTRWLKLRNCLLMNCFAFVLHSWSLKEVSTRRETDRSLHFVGGGACNVLCKRKVENWVNKHFRWTKMVKFAFLSKVNPWPSIDKLALPY